MRGRPSGHKPGQPCIVDGCDRLSIKTGVCAKHYFRMRRNGSYDLPRKVRVTTFVSQGYRFQLVEENTWRREHQLVVEKAIGRKLVKGEHVHHINGNTTDNRNCNLLVCNSAYHTFLHFRMAELWQQTHFKDIEA